MSQDTNEPFDSSQAVLAQTPRQFTVRGKRRCWLEPSVRLWVILTAIICIATIWSGAKSLLTWLEDKKLIEQGAEVQAMVYLSDDAAKIKKRVVSLANPVLLEYTYQGKQFSKTVFMRNVGQDYLSGVPFPIKVSPDNPDRWTNLKEVPALVQEMTGTLLLAASALLAALIGWLSLQSIRMIWKRGELRTGRVLEHRQTAIAPRSTALRVAVPTGRVDRVASVFIPQDANPPAVGQPIDLVTNASATRVLAVQNFYP
jgi:hypothetical protein